MEYVREFKHYIDDHFVQSKESALKITLAIQDSELNAGNGNYTRTLHVPKFFSQADKKQFQAIVEKTYRILTKIIVLYKQEAEIRRLFPFSKELEELILIDPGYKSLIPICRIDIFFDEKNKSFHFCEINTDGTSAMNENYRLDQLLSLNNAYMALKPDVEHLELMESWIDAFLATYASSKEAKEKPNVAIVDFLENAYISEFYQFQKRFEKRGLVCEIVDARDLKYDGQQLINQKTGTPIDVIYRRAVTRDIMDHLDQVHDLIQAYKEGKIVLIGAFQTQIVHHKCISQVLFDEKVRKHFSEEEKAFIDAHFPRTYDLTEEIAEKIEKDKNHWIIKPKDSYAAKGVWAGVDLDQTHWKKVIYDFIDHDYIAQQYVRPYQSENIDLVNYNVWRDYSNLTGLYTYNGQFAGVYSRLSDSGIISTQYNEKTIATLFTK